MADRKATLTAVLVDAVSGTAKTIKAEVKGIGDQVSATTSLLTGIGQGIGQQLLRGAEDVFRTITELFPKLLDSGNAYLNQLHMIQLETGMTAEQTSTLVGSIIALGAPVDSLDVLFARLGANLGKNEGLFRQLGVATRDTNGNLLDSYTIFQNIRRAVQEHGQSLLSTAAAQELFGRSGYQLIAALQASDAEWATATENVRRWGGVVSQQAIDGAHALDRTLASLGQGITDIGVNIASAIDPYLRAFVDAFSRFVQAHLNDIINFAVGVTNTVIGFVSGLFGITDSLSVSADSVVSSTAKAGTGTDNFGKIVKAAAGGVDAFTTSINNQIKAIDAHIAAIASAAERRRAIEERARLQQSLAAAQAQLADLQGNAPFLGGLSAAEQALAVQKHAQDIIDAEKNVQGAKQAIGDFEANQKDIAERELLNREKQRLQDSLAAHKATNAAILSSGLQMGKGLDTSIGTVLGNLGIKSQEFGRTAAASFKTGVDAAKGFLEILVGSEHFAGVDAKGNVLTTRSGGVVGALGVVGEILRAVGDAGGWVVRNAGGLPQFLRDLNTQAQWLSDQLYNLEHGKLPVILPNTPGFPGLDFLNNPPPRAAGGPVSPGTLYRVNEQGTEQFFAPNVRGTILAAGQGSGVGVTIIVNNDFLSKPSDEQLREVAEKISRRLSFNLANTGSTSRPSGAF